MRSQPADRRHKGRVVKEKPPARLSRSRLVHAGRERLEVPGPVNPPVVRGSTILHATVAAARQAEAAHREGRRVPNYGRRGSDTVFALEDAIVEMEGGHGARLTACGLAANALVFQAYLRPGDHVLIADCVYGPVQRFVADFLTPFGIHSDYFALQDDNSDLAGKLKPETKLVYVETPGSVLFEIADLPALSKIAHDHGALVAVDNTWGSGWTYRPLALGADVSVIAATKYLGGHSDLLLGAAVANEAAWPALNRMAEAVGSAVSPDDASLALRGLRTLDLRMREHERQATALADWFAAQPFVRRVYFPPRADHAGHALWQRDFAGACGLFSVEFAGVSDANVERFVDALELFGIGSSWGGYESLVRIENRATLRRVAPAPEGPIVRFHAGLEACEDLIADLEQASAGLRSKG